MKKYHFAIKKGNEKKSVSYDGRITDFNSLDNSNRHSMSDIRKYIESWQIVGIQGINKLVFKRDNRQHSIEV